MRVTNEEPKPKVAEADFNGTLIEHKKGRILSLTKGKTKIKIVNGNILPAWLKLHGNEKEKSKSKTS